MKSKVVGIGILWRFVVRGWIVRCGLRHCRLEREAVGVRNEPVMVVFVSK